LTQLKTRLEHTKTKLESNDQAQIAALTREDLLGDLFRVGTLGYYAQLIGLNHIMGLQAGGHYQLGAGTGTFGYEPKVSYFFGFPKAIEAGGVVFDIPLFTIAGVNDGDPVKKKQFVLQAGLLSSALEHAVPEQLFVNAQNPGEAISAVKALQKASAVGQRIYHITQANQSTILANIHHDSDTMAEIQNALNAGKEVITHTDAVSVPGWSGAGYIITDPVTGDGAYKIAGGGNGGNYSAESVGLIAVSILSLVVLTGTMASLILVYFIISALAIGLAILFAELLEDPNQFWVEKGQITAILAFALSPLGGLGIVAPAGVEALMLQIVSTILGVIGAI
jgi:hypothetical protein